MAETQNSPFALKTRDANNMPAERKASALNVMAHRYNVEPEKLLATLKATVFKGATNEELLALVVVANEYKLSPFLKQIYAFPAKGGGITPVVSIDGWLKIVNEQKDLDGIEFEEIEGPDGKPVKTTCLLYVKGRSKPVKVPERYSECARNTEPWNKMPFRMLRHKALIQCARVAFGLGGILDEDEAADAAGRVPRATRATFDVPVETQPEPRQIAPKPAASEDDGDLGPVATETGSTLPPETTDVPAEPGMPQDAPAPAPAPKPEPAKRAKKEAPPVSPLDTLKALIASANFKESEILEACIKKFQAPNANAISEWPVEYITEVVTNWRLVANETKTIRLLAA